MQIQLNRIIPKQIPAQLAADSQIWGEEVTFGHENMLVLAPSGSGKSTFCKVLYGLNSSHRSEILFDGQRFSDFSDSEIADLRVAKMSYVPQNMLLFERLTAWENLMVKHQLRQVWSESEIRQVLEKLNIAAQSEQIVGTMSLGQQQRLAILRALIQPFELLVLDEPFSHLDEENERIALELIMEICKKQNAKFVITSLGNKHGLSNEKVVVRQL